MACHTDVAGSTLGVEHAQLNNLFRFRNRAYRHQLITANAIGVLTDPLPDVPANLAALVNPAVVTEPLEKGSVLPACQLFRLSPGPHTTPSSMSLFTW
jgi:hypothetical protein